MHEFEHPQVVQKLNNASFTNPAYLSPSFPYLPRQHSLQEGTLDESIVFRKGGRSFLGWRPKSPSYEAWVTGGGVEVTWGGGKLIWSVTVDEFKGSRS